MALFLMASGHRIVEVAAIRAGSGLFFPTQFRFRALFFSPVRVKYVFIRVSLGLKLFLFGPVSGPIFKVGFDFSEFNLIFWV